MGHDNIETREESQAVQKASDAYEDAEGLLLPEGRGAFRAGWVASREYHRRQAEKEIADATRRLAARQELRLMDCHHTPGCGSVAECQRRR